MLRSVAVTRINAGLGFRSGLDSTIILRLQEAQRELESGKTLPRFLLEEDVTLSLASGAHTVALPTGYIRFAENGLRYYATGSEKPIFLVRKSYPDAVQAYIGEDNDPKGPKVYAIRNGSIDFITTADQAYTIYADYYKRADVLTTDIENAWLADLSGGAEWLIGEAGMRMAADLRDKDAISIFNTMVSRAHAAFFGNELAEEEADGPFVMGSDA